MKQQDDLSTLQLQVLSSSPNVLPSLAGFPAQGVRAVAGRTLLASDLRHDGTGYALATAIGAESVQRIAGGELEHFRDIPHDCFAWGFLQYQHILGLYDDPFASVAKGTIQIHSNRYLTLARHLSKNY